MKTFRDCSSYTVSLSGQNTKFAVEQAKCVSVAKTILDMVVLCTENNTLNAEKSLASLKILAVYYFLIGTWHLSEQ